jgi:hypothetical protein
MKKLNLTPAGAIKIANGGRMNHVQIIGGSNTMQKNSVLKRNMYGHQIGRDGRVAKVAETTETIPVSPGMRRQQKGDIAYHGGVAVDDLPNVPLSREQPIAVAFGMSDAQKAAHAASPSAADVLRDAATLGRKA